MRVCFWWSNDNHGNIDLSQDFYQFVLAIKIFKIIVKQRVKFIFSDPLFIYPLILILDDIYNFAISINKTE
jgi:hypothetical protein